MKAMLTMMAGKKTYGLLALGAVSILINHFFGPVPGLNLDPDNWLNDLWGLGVGATMRAGISKVA